MQRALCSEAELDPKGPGFFSGLFVSHGNMAGTTRLELATSAVTGQRSNQLNYVPFNNLQKHRFGWCL
jgi:hypothetical protein